MTWPDIADVTATVCFVAATFFALVAAVGILRFPDLLTRMHSATKPQALGLLLALLGLAFSLRSWGVLGMLGLIALFQMATTPIASHMVGRAAFRRRLVRQDLLVVDELSETLEHEEPRGAP